MLERTKGEKSLPRIGVRDDDRTRNERGNLYGLSASGSCASAGDTLELLAFDDEFDPLAVDDSEIDQEWMDDENPYDTIDYPTMRNMPETVHHDPVYSPARQGSATEALQALIVRNPNRRPVLLNIIGLCEGAAPRASFPSAWMSGSATTGRYTLP